MVSKTITALFFIISMQAAAQNAYRNLPTIDVFTLNNSAFEEGMISFKVHPHQLANFNFSLRNGLVNFNNKQLNEIAAKYEFKTIKNIFSNALKNTEYMVKHTQYSLQCWFTISFDSNHSVQRLWFDLRQTQLFETVEPVYKKHLLAHNNSVNYLPNDPLLNNQWHYNNTGQSGGRAGADIKLQQAWDIETGKPNVLVAVNDMGIQLNHPDLTQNIALAKHFNFIQNNDTITPGYHGTHVAGTIAAVNNNGIMVSGIAGGDGTANSGVRLMSMEIFEGKVNAGNAEAFVMSADNGACISNNSWAYDVEDVYELSVMDAIDYFIEHGGGTALQGGLVIFAAGNLSRQIRYYPSAYDAVLCVAATNHKDEKSNYSTFGSWVDIAAPGGDYSNGPTTQILSTTIGSGYAGDHGTSMACPHVAGVAALIASKLLGKASASDIREILTSTTDNIDAYNPNFIGLLGSGRLNAFKALQKAEAIANAVWVAAPSNLKILNNCSNFDINWQKNSNTNNVLLVYSNLNNMATPVNGKLYSVGDYLGDGRVVYAGSASNFSITNNHQLLHFFKIYSIDANNNYSLSIAKQMTTNSVIEASGDIIQNFDAPPLFPTQQWRTINADNDISWTHTAQDTAHTGAGDDYSMCMYNYNFNKTLGAKDWLISPVINLHQPQNLSCSFWYAYQYRSTGFLIADSLEVLVSTDCGNTYNSLWKLGGASLATTSSIADSAFYPFVLDKWKKITIDLIAYKQSQNIMFGFKATNGKGNNIFLDNINLGVHYDNDVAITAIKNLNQNHCYQSVSPLVVFKNVGANTITSLNIEYVLNANNPILSGWMGNLKSGDSIMLSLPTATVNLGENTIKVYVTKVNEQADSYHLNDSLLTSFTNCKKMSLPFADGFESSNDLTKTYTVQSSKSYAITWRKTNKIAYTGSNCLLMQNFVYNDKKVVDYIATPNFYVDKDLDTLNIRFDYAHATRLSPADTTQKFDTLQIELSKDCGATWKTIWKKGGNDLQTIGQTQGYFKEFIPDLTQWKNVAVALPNDIKKGNDVQVRFKNINYYGNNIYIDNLNIAYDYIPELVKQNNFVVYPNPCLNFVKIEAKNNYILKVLKIYDCFGKQLDIKKINSQKGYISLEKYAAGTYLLVIEGLDRIFYQKVVKIN